MKNKFLERNNIKPESLHELPKAASGFPPRQRDGEGKSFEVFDPERYPISMTNALLDDLGWIEGGDSGFLTRQERTRLEKLRDQPEVSGLDEVGQREAAAKLQNYENSPRRINTLNKALAAIVDIAQAHAVAGLDADHYLREALRFRDMIIRDTGQGLDEQVPMSRSIPSGIRQLLVELKKDLHKHGIKDTPQ